MNSTIRKTIHLLTMTFLFSAILLICAYAEEPYTVNMDDENPKITIAVGKNMVLEVISNEKKVDLSKVTFRSSKKKVSIVTKSGLLMGKEKGNAVITVKYRKKTVKLNVAVKKTEGDSEGSSGAGKMTCTDGSTIKTGKVITLKLNKTAVSHDWTWSFTGTAAKDARILSDKYKKSGKITFTVWPSGGTLDVIGTDPAGAVIKCSFTVKQTAVWKRREQFRNSVLAALTPGMTKAQMMKYFVDYIADHTSYAHGNYFGVMDGKNGDCISYSAGFKFLTDAIGVETIIVKNGGAKSHYWCQVKLDDVWYNVDAQGYDTSRSRKWFLSSDARHGWYGDTTFQQQNGIWYPFSPAQVCTQNYKM